LKIESAGKRERDSLSPGTHPAFRGASWKFPETPDEWQEKVSPDIMFPRLIAKSRSAFSKSRVIQKADWRQKSRVIMKTPAPAFWHQKSPNESTVKLYILHSCCPEEEPHSQYKLIVY
jgi:hypothetical protein